MKKIIFIALLLMGVNLNAQNNLLQSGPMVGYSDMMEVKLWAQTNAPAQVAIRYWEKGKPETKWKTDVVKTKKETAFVAHLIADQVKPTRKYEYELLINDKVVPRPYPLEFQTQTLWQWRTDAPNVRFAIGSCAYVNEPEYDRPNQTYGGHYEIFQSLAKAKPEFMLWLGDNAYLREVDWSTRTGILHRYTHTRSLPELQPFWGSVHHYAIWDDHDYGVNDADRSYWGKNLTEEAFNLFWANPNVNLTGKGGITGTFQWSDIQFFLLDNRYHRSPNDDQTRPRQMFGDEQIQWLIDALVNSKATFKFVATGGQMVNDVPKYETFSTYPEEKQKLFSAIQKAGIKGVIFLTGDRHHSEISKMNREGTYPLYDITCSPLTAGPHADPSENNTYRLPNTLVGERNYSIMEVTGAKNDRVLSIKMYDTTGKELTQYQIKSSELK